MGSRASAVIIYGFTFVHDWESEDPEPDFTYEQGELWEAKCYAAENVPESRPAHVDWPEHQASKKAAMRKHGQYEPWGSKYDEPCHAFGFVLASGDWDGASELGDLQPPKDAEERLKKLCKFYGVTPQPPKMLMLCSYG